MGALIKSIDFSFDNRVRYLKDWRFRMRTESVGLFLSELVHLTRFEARFRRVQFDKGLFVMSLDVDVGSHLLGKEYNGLCDKKIHNYLPESRLGEIEELVVPQLAKLFDDFEIPVTFAVRGKLAEVDNGIIDVIRRFDVKHEIAAHGFSHRTFTSLTTAEAEDELKKVSIEMKKFNIEPKSFVFPKNKIAHLSLLEKYGYKCYRGRAGFKYDDLYVEKVGQLYDVHPSYFLGRIPPPLFPNKIIDLATRRKQPCHFWFHPSDLGHDQLTLQKTLDRLILPFLRYAKKKEKDGVLGFETMISIVKKIEHAKC
jgi:peptidoglycan/xylan/chitin deacetylase (PgdA/CDA1 family)